MAKKNEKIVKTKYQKFEFSSGNLAVESDLTKYESKCSELKVAKKNE